VPVCRNYGCCEFHLPARALKRNTQLEELGLADNYLDAKALTEFGSALEANSSLKTLNLSGVHKRTDVSEDGA
jgi:hypothetical protein